MGGSSLAPDILHRTFGSQDGYLALRILDSTDPGLRQRDPRRPRPAPDPHDHRHEVGHDDRAERLPRLSPGRASRHALKAVGHHTLRPPRRVLRGRHGPGQERRRDPPSRRLPRGLPQPARHRRAVLGPDLRRPGPGLADRHRPRRAPGLGQHDGRRLPRARPGGQPGRLAGPRHRDPRRQPAATSSRSSPTTRSPASAPGWSSSSPRAPASTASGSSRSTSSRSARWTPTATDRAFVRLALGGLPTTAVATRSRQPWRRPATR